MIELKSATLAVSFPEKPFQPEIRIEFQRTLRIPDDGKNYPLPPGLGRFPLRHIDDYAPRIPQTWLKRGGVLLPMWQAEALWVNFSSEYIPGRPSSYPFAIKVATGRVNAVSGELWKGGLSRNPQDYLVVPGQPWLDGYCVEKGIIRQFVAMPLGQGFSVEEQVTGQAEFGGIQLEVFPMKPEVFDRRFPVIRQKGVRSRGAVLEDLCLSKAAACEMGLAPGGRMRQEIYEDPFSIHDWDTSHSSRCFIHLVNSTTWRAITGEAPPTTPPTSRDYTHAGFPWFDYYDAELNAVKGSKVLGGLQSVNEKLIEKRQEPLPDNESENVLNVKNLRPGLTRHQVREADF
jgi:hypothetical protein